MIARMGNYWVVHCKRDDYDVYIGRGSEWGNPFRIGPDGSRDDVIRKYKVWLAACGPKMVERIKVKLKGKTLGCWCSPKSCHREVLAKIANE